MVEPEFTVYDKAQWSNVTKYFNSKPTFHFNLISTARPAGSQQCAEATYPELYSG